MKTISASSSLKCTRWTWTFLGRARLKVAATCFALIMVDFVAVIGVAAASTPSMSETTGGVTGAPIQRPNISGATHNYLYVADFNAAQVSVLDTSTNTVVATIPVGNSPEDVIVNKAQTYAYVSNEGSDTVSVISTETNTVVATVTVGLNPSTLWDAGNDVWAVAQDSEGRPTGYEIDTTTNQVISELLLYGANSPYPTAPKNASGTLAYVADYVNNAVSVYQTSDWTIVDSIPLGTQPDPLSDTPLNSAGNDIYVVDWQNNVQVVDILTDAIVATVPIAPYTLGMALNPAGTYAYFADTGGLTGSEISVMNTATNTVVARISLPQLSDPDKIVLNSSGTVAYVADYNSGSVSVINATTNTLITTVQLGADFYPSNLALESQPSVAKIPASVTVRFAPGKSALSIPDQRSLKAFAKSLTPGSTVTVATFAYRNLNLCKVRANSIVVYLLRFARFHARFTRETTKRQNLGTVAVS
jgi:YVTN family beta-propeller protein